MGRGSRLVVARTFTLYQHLEGAPEQIATWTEALTRNLPDSWGKSPDYLTALTRILPERQIIDDKIRGIIDSETGNFVGCHLSNYVDGVDIIVSSMQSPNKPILYFDDGSLKRAALEKLTETGYRRKEAPSTFFSPDWTHDKILEEIAFVLSVQGNQQTLRKWQGFASDGVTAILVEFRGLENALTILKFFPVYN